MATYNVNRETGELIPVSGGTLYADTPVGTILPYGGTVAPAGWLICDGSALKRSTYAELFSVIGTQFGVGDGSTTFNLPDMREAVPKGAGLTGKSIGNHVSTNGLAVGEFIDDRIQDHIHTQGGSLEYYNAPSGSGSGLGLITTSNTGGVITTHGARTGVTTEVKSVGVSYIIKAQRVAVPADFINSIEDTLSDMGIGDFISSSGSSESVTNSDFDIVTLQVPRGKWIVISESYINISGSMLRVTLHGSGLTVSGGSAVNTGEMGGNTCVAAIVRNDTNSNKTLILSGYGYASYTQYGYISGIKIAEN